MTSTQTLYQTDFDLWLQETAKLLRNGAVEQLNYQNLAEEIEDVAGSRKDALESNQIRVLQHLLKWKYQPQKRTNIWEASITEHYLRANTWTAIERFYLCWRCCECIYKNIRTI